MEKAIEIDNPNERGKKEWAFQIYNTVGLKMKHTFQKRTITSIYKSYILII